MNQLSAIALTIAVAAAGVWCEQWQPLAWVKAATRAKGFEGGEGGQVIKSIAVSPAAPNFIIAGTDVGGMYRTDDGGRHWEPANRDFSCGGANALAIDPRNADRVIALGCNSSPALYNGLWLSTDRGRSWRMVLGLNISGHGDNRSEQIDFDPTSYDQTKGYCTRAYWSRESAGHAQWGTPDVHGALYRTEDGGTTWSEIPNSGAYGEAVLRVMPRTGTLLVGTAAGLFGSTDRGAGFTSLLTDPVVGIDIPWTFGDSAYVSTANGTVMLLAGGTTRVIGQSGANLPKASDNGPAEFWHVSVSPVDPSRILVSVFTKGAWWDWNTYVTGDGGTTWRLVTHDLTDCIAPSNQRAANVRWSFTDRNVAVGTGRGDYLARTVDGGVTFAWWNNGNSAAMQGGYFTFNVDNPDILLMTTQDYNSALTLDGGQTWRTIQFGAGWGGYQYGGYAVSSRVMFAFKAEGWDWRKHISITRDGGSTFNEFALTDSTWRYMATGANVCAAAPGDTNTLFAGAWRSTDQGLSWSLMSGCDGVFCSNPQGQRELYGLKRNHAVRSYDKGVTWDSISPEFTPYVQDLAYDHTKNRVWAVGGWGTVYCYDVGAKAAVSVGSRPGDQQGNNTSYTVAVDPQNTDVVYIGGWRGIVKPTTSVVRSVDGGKTWSSITNNPAYGRDGGKEAVSLRVHPRTRELFVGSMCHGQWKIGAPGSTSVPRHRGADLNTGSAASRTVRLAMGSGHAAARTRLPGAVYSPDGSRGIDKDFLSQGLYFAIAP